MQQSSTWIGRWAEDIACAYLCQQGLKMLKRNYRCFAGEIDLIMQQGEILVFVEVRYRMLLHHGESIDIHKQHRVITTATHYLSTHRSLQKYACRFDVILISGRRKDPQLRWITDAFREN